MKPRLAQLHQSGATDRQVPIWDASAGYWIVGDQVGSVPCRATLVAAGGETIIYLGATPVASSEQIHINGLAVAWGGVGYTLVGSVAFLTTALSAADRVIVTYSTTSTCGIAALAKPPTGFTRPVSITRPPRRFHRIR